MGLILCMLLARSDVCELFGEFFHISMPLMWWSTNGSEVDMPEVMNGTVLSFTLNIAQTNPHASTW